MPPTARRRVVKPADVRTEELLASAERVFAARGIDATTVAEITADAGVAKGNFYRYFESKEHLLGALKARFYAQLIARIDEVATARLADGWPALLDAIVDTLVDFFFERADLVRVLARDATASGSTALFNCERALTAQIATGMRAGIADGGFGAVDPDLTAALLQHGVVRTVEYALIYDEPVTRDAIASAAREVARKALAP